MRAEIVAEKGRKPSLDRFRSHVEQCRERLLAGLGRSGDGAQLAAYFQRGKMLRGRLVLVAAAAVGSDPALAMAAAEAVELLHGASLFHDDLIDGADERRGLPALHRKAGAGAAIVLGDLLLLRAFTVLSESGSNGHPAERVLQAISVLGAQAQACCSGQLLELRTDGEVGSESDYLAIAEGKTAAPFVAAATVGAILGGGSAGECQALATYGLHVGVAFQLCDDMLDLLGDPLLLGKPVGNSLARGRPLLPLIYLRREGSAAGRAAWQAASSRGGGRLELMSILRREGIDAKVKALQTAHIAAAITSLRILPDSDGLQALLDLPDAAIVWWE